MIEAKAPHHNRNPKRSRSLLLRVLRQRAYGVRSTFTYSSQGHKMDVYFLRNQSRVLTQYIASLLSCVDLQELYKVLNCLA